MSINNNDLHTILAWADQEAARGDQTLAALALGTSPMQISRTIKAAREGRETPQTKPLTAWIRMGGTRASRNMQQLAARILDQLERVETVDRVSVGELVAQLSQLEEFKLRSPKQLQNALLSVVPAIYDWVDDEWYVHGVRVKVYA